MNAIKGSVVRAKRQGINQDLATCREVSEMEFIHRAEIAVQIKEKVDAIQLRFPYLLALSSHAMAVRNQEEQLGTLIPKVKLTKEEASVTVKQ